MCPSPLDDVVVRLKESIPKLIDKAIGAGSDDPGVDDDVVELTTLADQCDAALAGAAPETPDAPGRVDPASPAS